VINAALHSHDQGREPGCAACDVDAALRNLSAAIGYSDTLLYVGRELNRIAPTRCRYCGLSPEEAALRLPDSKAPATVCRLDGHDLPPAPPDCVVCRYPDS
jgi:hypothetical protein